MPAHVLSIEQDASDIVVGVDVCNEMDDAPAVGWGNGAVNAQMISDMSALVNSVRAVSRLPLSVSIQVAAPRPWD